VACPPPAASGCWCGDDQRVVRVLSVPILPQSNVSLVVRTHFGDDEAWQHVCEEIARPSDEGFTANVEFVSDRAFEGFNASALKAAMPASGTVAVLFAVDETTLTSADHPVLVVDLVDFDGEALEPFRSIPAELWGIENNLNIANMDWEDFAGAADRSGVFRGFAG
jgi:hypothetical protein